nr:MAG TPA: hypothetical protein [Caudoviricetes sp.]
MLFKNTSNLLIFFKILSFSRFVILFIRLYILLNVVIF